MTVSIGLIAVLTADSTSWAVLVPETPIRPTLSTSRVPKMVHSRRMVRRATVIVLLGPPWPYDSMSARRAGVRVRDEDFFHQVKLLEDHAGPTYHAGQRIVGHVHRLS